MLAEGSAGVNSRSVLRAGTKTQPLHHKESDNLINVTIYSAGPLWRALGTQMLPVGPSAQGRHDNLLNAARLFREAGGRSGSGSTRGKYLP